MDRQIGIAIGIPEPYGGELQRWRRRFGDPQSWAIVPHVTLVPPMEVGEETLAKVEDHLSAVAQEGRAFEIHLRGTGTFRPVSPVVFVQLATGVADCERLEEQVRSGPLTRELSFPYHPHVTVAHDVAVHHLDDAYAELGDYEARFPVWGFTLFERSVEGVWRPQRDFPFGRPLPGPDLGHPQPTSPEGAPSSSWG